MNNNEQFTRAVQVGLATLSSPDTKVVSTDIEALADFKNILRALLGG